MTGGAPRGPRSLENVPDHELVALVRAGDAAAYATLWKRHSGSAYGVARSFTYLDADDLVSEAFVKVLDAIKAGGGPVRAFRPYITMTVRNVARTLHVREASLVDADLDARRTEVPNGEVAAVVRFERDVTLEAFNSLPERWQQALWYSEVDGLKAGTISRILGIPANAVSALLVRARRAFRDAWVSAHSAAAATPECAATIRDLGAFVQHRLSSRRRAAVEAHLATCESCRAALAEARHASSMILVLLPLVAAATAHAARTAADTAPQALGWLVAARTVVARAATGGDSERIRSRWHPRPRLGCRSRADRRDDSGDRDRAGCDVGDGARGSRRRAAGGALRRGVERRGGCDGIRRGRPPRHRSLLGGVTRGMGRTQPRGRASGVRARVCAACAPRARTSPARLSFTAPQSRIRERSTALVRVVVPPS